MWSLYPVQPTINKYICYVEIDVKHHPKIQHINIWVFKWITEVVVQVCTGIIGLDLLFMASLACRKAVSRKPNLPESSLGALWEMCSCSASPGAPESSWMLIMKLL